MVGVDRESSWQTTVRGVSVAELDQDYQEYLRKWTERYGDSDEGEVSYSYRDEKVTVPLRRMTAGEFVVAVNELVKIRQRYYDAEERSDVDGLRKARSAAFPYELILLF
jgi:hypothetical protein